MVNLNTFSDSEKGKEKELRLDPPPLDDMYDDDYMQSPIDISDGDSDFGSGYSEVGLLEEEEEGGPLFDEEGNLYGIGSPSDASHLPDPSEPSASPKGPVRFSLKPAIRRISNSFLGTPSEGTSSGGSPGPSFPNMLCVVRADE